MGWLRSGTETLTLVGGGTRQHALSYSYDMRSQLRSGSVTNINGTTWTASFTYDKAGNVTQQTVGGTETDFGYDGDLMTDKGANTLDWDADGRMISGLSRSLTYNWDSKLRSATSGSTTVALRYDPDGNRVLRSVNSTTSRKYVVDTVVGLPTILLEIDTAVQDPNDAIVKTYIYANSQIIAQHDGFYGDALYFYLHDRLGSVREVINTSAAVVSTYTYEPFGQSFSTEVTQNIANPWQFTGQYFDSEFDQYFLRARQYDPAIYRFTARDPYDGSFQEPLEIHRYLYCQNDGINETDPTGEMAGLIGALGISAGRLLYDAQTITIGKYLSEELERLTAEHAKKTNLVTEAMQMGQAGEYALERALNLQNKQVRRYFANGSYRVFDFEDDGVYIEVKNRKVLNLTQQLRDMLELVKLDRNGKGFVIVVRKNTIISDNLQVWADENNVKIHKIIPEKGE